MIDHLNNALRHLLLAQMAELTTEDQIRFEPPDDEWRTAVANLNQVALNIYLADLRENRKLRSNARTRQYANGLVDETPAPRRMDCHYLITAWSPATPGPALEPILDEQALLYQATAVLMNNEPFIPRQVYAPDPLPPTFPDLFADAELPTQILPAEGFPKLAEFWGTMGANHRWKPAVYLVVTLPVALQTQTAGPMVTTRISEYRRTGRPETAQVWIQIGGQVVDAIHPDPDTGDPIPVPGAWVRLETTGGEPLQTTETNELGRFTFSGLQPGQYRLNWQAAGLPAPPAPRTIGVPSPTGEYDLRFE